MNVAHAVDPQVYNRAWNPTEVSINFPDLGDVERVLTAVGHPEPKVATIELSRLLCKDADRGILRGHRIDDGISIPEAGWGRLQVERALEFRTAESGDRYVEVSNGIDIHVVDRGVTVSLKADRTLKGIVFSAIAVDFLPVCSTAERWKISTESLGENAHWFLKGMRAEAPDSRNWTPKAFSFKDGLFSCKVERTTPAVGGWQLNGISLDGGSLGEIVAVTECIATDALRGAVDSRFVETAMKALRKPRDDLRLGHLRSALFKGAAGNDRPTKFFMEYGYVVGVSAQCLFYPRAITVPAGSSSDPLGGLILEVTDNPFNPNSLRAYIDRSGSAREIRDEVVQFDRIGRHDPTFNLIFCGGNDDELVSSRRHAAVQGVLAALGSRVRIEEALAHVEIVASEEEVKDGYSASLVIEDLPIRVDCSWSPLGYAKA